VAAGETGVVSLNEPAEGWTLVEVTAVADPVAKGGVEMSVGLCGYAARVTATAGEGQTYRLIFPCGDSQGHEVLVRNMAMEFDWQAGVAATVVFSKIVVHSKLEFGGLSPMSAPPLLTLSNQDAGTVLLDSTGLLDLEPQHGHMEALAWLAHFAGVPGDTPLSVRLAATQLDVHDSALHEVVGEEVWLRDNGQLAGEVNFPASGPYRFLVTGRGTEANGAFPHPELRVDGKPVGTVSFSGEPETSFVDAQVDAGSHSVAVAFVDDAYMPPEDRDAAFSRLEIAALRANRLPSASVSWQPGGQELAVEAKCMFDPDGDELSLSWRLSAVGCGMDDSGAAQGAAASFAVASGNYRVTLSADDGRGGVSTACAEVDWEAATSFPPDSRGPAADPLEGYPLDVAQQPAPECCLEGQPAGDAGCGCRIGGPKAVPAASLLLLSLLAGLLLLARYR